MFDLKTISTLDDSCLIEKFSISVRKERETLSEVIAHLSQILKRQLYLKEGYSSLFNYLREKFQYSESAAYRRIQAAKITLLYAEILGLLENGKVNLSTLSLIEPQLTKENARSVIDQIIGKSKREVEYLLAEMAVPRKSMVMQDRIRRLPVLVRREFPVSEGNRGMEKHKEFAMGLEKNETHGSLEVSTDKPLQGNDLSTGNGVSNSAHFYTAAAEEVAGEGKAAAPLKVPAAFPSQPTEPKQEIRRIKIEFVSEEGMAKKIERAKEILRHKFPEGRFEDIFNQALEDMLEKRDPMRKIERIEKRNEKKMSESEMKTEKRKDGQEENQKKPIEVTEKKPVSQKSSLNPSAKSMTSRYIPQEIKRKIWGKDGGKCSYQSSDGKRCEERAFLQFDHVEPWALGGKSTEENLRLLCSRHNRWRAEQTFKYRHT